MFYINIYIYIFRDRIFEKMYKDILRERKENHQYSEGKCGIDIIYKSENICEGF